MKVDARNLLDKKKWKSQTVGSISKNWGLNKNKQRFAKSTGVFDARKVLNSKQGRKVKSKTNFRSTAPRSFSSAGPKNTLPQAPKPLYPGKRVQVSHDGNLIITAKPKGQQLIAKSSPKHSRQNVALPTRYIPAQKVQAWEPSAVDMDDLEHVGINDLIDMESLPPAVVTPSVSRKTVLPHQNTMVADQIASVSRHQNTQVYVKNLGASVSKQDIMELFGDIGPIKNVEVMYPNTAVIAYYDPKDAANACDIYHNRLLDGQPMKCSLQSNVHPYKPITQRLGSRIQSSPTVPLFRSASPLLSSSRSRYNPRDVRFTVKL